MMQNGFRRINVMAGNYANWTPSLPSNIQYDLYSLLENYYKVWIDNDIYEREALFHIWFMKIHPFEDGNKRSAKIILNANLIKQNIPPILIGEEDTKKYYEFINNDDVLGFADYIKSKSLQEQGTLISYYKLEKSIPINESLITYLDGFDRK